MLERGHRELAFVVRTEEQRNHMNPSIPTREINHFVVVVIVVEEAVVVLFANKDLHR